MYLLPDKLSEFQSKLLEWYKVNKRDFPWRKNSDPYRILVAEILLQRTRAELVEDVYRKFMEKYPDVFALHKAKVTQLTKEIRTLGLAKRATYLKRAANYIVEKQGGCIPDDQTSLEKIPGIGKYAASAILCFSFGRRTPIVDVNVVRLFARIFGVESQKPRPDKDPKYWELGKLVVPEKSFMDFNYALLDLAALVCLRKPKCQICPINEFCHFYRKSQYHQKV